MNYYQDANKGRSLEETGNRPKNDAASSGRSNADAASQAPTEVTRNRRLQLQLTLAVIAYLPVPLLSWIATTTLQPPIWLLLATQGWLSMSATAVFCVVMFCRYGEAFISWPNVEAMRGGDDSQPNQKASSPSRVPTCYASSELP